MSSVAGSLFGSSGQERPSQQASGFAALPSDLQNVFRDLTLTAGDFIASTGDAFRPIDLTSQEIMVGEQFGLPFTDPAAYSQSVQSFLNPYRDIITQDINRDFEGAFNAANAAASQAGAFGSTRQMQALGDVERARSDAISRAMADQYGQALGQRQQSLGNLLGFGGLQRDLSLQQSQAPLNQLGAVSNIISPLLGTSTGTGRYTTQGSSGSVNDIASIAQLGMSLAGLFSDERLKKNIVKIGRKNNLDLYEYEYLWSPQKFIGYMAQEVKEKFPQAISYIGKYMTVDYGVINGK